MSSLSLLQAIDVIKKALVMVLNDCTPRRREFWGQAPDKDKRWVRLWESGRLLPHPLTSSQVRQLPLLSLLV